MSVLLYRYLILMKVHKVIPILSTFNLVVCVCLCVFSCVRLYTLWTIACQAPLSMGFSRQEYWSGLLFPLPGTLPNPRIEPHLLPALAGEFFSTSATWEAQFPDIFLILVLY